MSLAKITEPSCGREKKNPCGTNYQLICMYIYMPTWLGKNGFVVQLPLLYWTA